MNHPASIIRNFSQFSCIDWSGAAVHRPPGLAVAHIGQHGPPALITPNPRWSREDIGDWLAGHADAQSDILIGIDMSFGFPYFDRSNYFPDWSSSPHDARALWALVDQICADDPHWGAASFLSHTQARRHFRHGKGDVGDLFGGGIGRLRLVESHQRTTKQASSWSCFNLVGAGQVGKSSLTGMRMLHRLNGRIPIWPFDPIPPSGPLLIEIYTSMAARAAGMPPGRSKIRDRAGLEHALAALDSPPPARLARYDDHSTDALITSAWLRQVQTNAALWNPDPLNFHIAATEGWTFGVI